MIMSVDMFINQGLENIGIGYNEVKSPIILVRTPNSKCKIIPNKNAKITQWSVFWKDLSLANNKTSTHVTPMVPTVSHKA